MTRARGAGGSMGSRRYVLPNKTVISWLQTGLLTWRKAALSDLGQIEEEWKERRKSRNRFCKRAYSQMRVVFFFFFDERNKNCVW